MIYHKFLLYVLIIEVSLILISSLIMLSVFFIMRKLAKITQKKKDNLSNKIVRYLFSKEAIDYSIFESVSPKLLVIVLEEFDLRLDDEKWNKLKTRLTKRFLITRARKYVYSKNWSKRIFAVKTFRLYCEHIDEKYIVKLLQDDLQFVRLTTIPAAMNLKTDKIVYTILEIIGKGSRFSSYAYKDALAKGGEKMYYQIKRHYLSTQDINIRIACLEVISFLTHHEPINYIERDLKSDNKILRLLATKVIARYPSQFSLDWFLKLAKDENWEIRAMAAKGLGSIHAEKTIPLLVKMMSDREWWVRINSAVALLEFDDRGRKILSSLDKDVDKFAYETAQYALSI